MRLSSEVSNPPGMVVKNDGQPVPLSNFIADVNTGQAQPAQTNTPLRFSSLSLLENGRSVPSSRSTLYDSGDRRFFHSSGVSLNGVASAATSAFFASSDFHPARSSSTCGEVAPGGTGFAA